MKKSEPFAYTEFITINGLSCAAFYMKDKSNIPNLLITIDTDEAGRVSRVYFLANPEKLRHLNLKRER